MVGSGQCHSSIYLDQHVNNRAPEHCPRSRCSHHSLTVLALDTSDRTRTSSKLERQGLGFTGFTGFTGCTGCGCVLLPSVLLLPKIHMMRAEPPCVD